ncbi:MAG: sulfotransferase [Saprospiraceae bacterium]
MPPPAPYKPNLFLIGAPRCGTTTLYQYLSSHSQIFFPRLKEPHFFATDIGLRNGSYKTSIADYRSLYETADKDAMYWGDASVFYLYSEQAPQNLYFFNADAKIVCILRQPVDAMYSLFLFSLRHGAENIPDFDRALKAEPLRKQGKRIPRAVFIEEALLYRSVTSYAAQLKRYYDLFPPENIRVFLYEDLVNRPGDMFRELSLFLGLENEFQRMSFYANRTKDVVFDSSKVLNRKYPDAMKWVRTLLPDGIRKSLQGLKKFERAPRIPPPLSPERRRELILEKEPEIRALAALINRNLDHWLYFE